VLKKIGRLRGRDVKEVNKRMYVEGGIGVDS